MGHGESADMPKSEIHYEMGELEAFGQTHTQRLGNYNIDLHNTLFEMVVVSFMRKMQ